MGRGRSDKTKELVQASRDILEDIQPASVRAVCYRLFAMGLLTAMKKNETNRVSVALRNAREEGRIPWEWISDETRQVEQGNMWDDPDAYLDTVKRAYRLDHWKLQPRHVEVWSEKSTVVGGIRPVLDAYGVPFRSFHGFNSCTQVKVLADAAAKSRQPWHVLYIGDFDPSGLHMSEVDLPRRLHDYGIASITITRVALVKNDVIDTDLSSFPLASKKSDTRYQWYKGNYGTLTSDRCWELDAMSPVVLRDRLKAAIKELIDIPQWNRSLAAEKAEQQSIATYMDGWKSISRPASKYANPRTKKKTVQGEQAIHKTLEEMGMTVAMVREARQVASIPRELLKQVLDGQVTREQALRIMKRQSVQAEAHDN